MSNEAGAKGNGSKNIPTETVYCIRGCSREEKDRYASSRTGCAARDPKEVKTPQAQSDSRYQLPASAGDLKKQAKKIAERTEDNPGRTRRGRIDF